jgi:DNA recombination protein RmuC
MVEYVFIALLILIALLLGFVVYRITRSTPKGGDAESVLMLQARLAELERAIDARLLSNSQEMRDSSQSIFKEVTSRLLDVQKGLSESQESSKQVLSITESLKNLEKVLKKKKQRGSLGEAGLELILSNILPPGSYSIQYGFKDGEIVDACIHAKEGLIPVDAKFSLDNYNRILEETDEVRREALEREFKNDLKKRIDETAKYIRPEEGTLPFAIMYIPAEGIYYDLLINQVGAVKVNTRSLIEYAYKDKKVIIVSPTTFVAYLQTILQGFRAFQIEKSAEIISRRVEELGRHLKAYEEYHDKLGGSLATVVNHFNASNKELQKIDKDVLRITGTSADLQSIALEKPTRE